MPNLLGKYCPTFAKWQSTIKRFIFRYKTGHSDGFLNGYQSGYMEGQAQGKRNMIKDLETKYQQQMVELNEKYKEAVSNARAKHVINFTDEFQFEMEEKQQLPKETFEVMKEIISSNQYVELRTFFAHHVMNFYHNARKISDKDHKRAMELMGDYMKDVIADMDRMRPKGDDEEELNDPYEL